MKLYFDLSSSAIPKTSIGIKTAQETTLKIFRAVSPLSLLINNNIRALPPSRVSTGSKLKHAKKSAEKESVSKSFIFVKQ